MMGEGGKVTGNATLLLGYVSAALTKPDGDWPYRLVAADPQTGSLQVENGHTGTVFLLTIVQVEGPEFA